MGETAHSACVLGDLIFVCHVGAGSWHGQGQTLWPRGITTRPPKCPFTTQGYKKRCNSNLSTKQGVAKLNIPVRCLESEHIVLNKPDVLLIPG